MLTCAGSHLVLGPIMHDPPAEGKHLVKAAPNYRLTSSTAPCRYNRHGACGCDPLRTPLQGPEGLSPQEAEKSGAVIEGEQQWGGAWAPTDNNRFCTTAGGALQVNLLVTAVQDHLAPRK